MVVHFEDVAKTACTKEANDLITECDMVSLDSLVISIIIIIELVSDLLHAVFAHLSRSRSSAMRSRHIVAWVGSLNLAANSSFTHEVDLIVTYYFD